MIAGIIVYGSLYPFAFRVPINGPGPIPALLKTWADRPGRGDFISNILLYLPFGCFAANALRADLVAWRRWVLVGLCGASLSISMELAQYYDEGRQTAATDVYSNVIGATLGAVVASMIDRNSRWPLLRDIATHPAPALLLAAWLAYGLFPYVPTIDLHKYWDVLKPILQHPIPEPYHLFRNCVTWLTVYALAATVGGRYRLLLWLPFLAGGVLLAKLLIITTTLSIEEMCGAALGFALWLLLAATPRLGAPVIAGLLVILVAAQRLEPFHFRAAPSPFGWIPFLSFMSGSIYVDVMSFLEKFFTYGSLIWFLHLAGARLSRAAALAAALLLTTSWIERYLPGRSAEVTDAVMSLMIGGIIGLVAALGPEETRPIAAPNSSS